MSARIYRFELPGKETTLTVPRNGIVQDCLNQNGRIDLYLLLDLTEKPEERHFRIFQTGEELPKWIWDCVHVRSLPAGLHIYEVPMHHLEKA